MSAAEMEVAVAAARAALASRGLRPAVVAHDAWLASGLETLLPETVVMCVQASNAVEHLRAQGIEVFCLSEVDPAVGAGPGGGDGRSSLDLFEHPASVDFCARVGALAVMAFKPTERLSAAVRARGGWLIDRPSPESFNVARTFENKVAFTTIASGVGITTPRWGIHQPGDLNFDELASAYGVPLVVQAPRGNAGQRTWFVHSPSDLADVTRRENRTPLRVAEFVTGTPFTATAVAGANGLTGWVEPCRQVTGIDWLTPMALGSCGNAWGAPSIRSLNEFALDNASRLAAALADRGYRGVFGIDFVLGENGPVVIEVNPRMVASLGVATQLQVEAGRVPALLAHLVGGLDAALPAAASNVRASLGPFSQVIVHQRPGDPPRGDVKGGIYGIGDPTQPVYRRPGAWVRELTGDDEALVMVRAKGEPVTLNREYARVYVRSHLGEAHPGLRECVAMLRGTE